MKIKKLFASILALIILVTLSSCGTKSKIEGKWAASYKMDWGNENLSVDEYPFLENTICTYYLVFTEEGTYALSRSISDNDKKNAIDGYKKLYTRYYEIEHTKDDIASIMANANCKTEDELIEQLLLQGAQAKGFSNYEDWICDILGISTAVISSGSYKIKGKDIIFDSSDKSPLSAMYKDSKVTLTYLDSSIDFELTE